MVWASLNCGCDPQKPRVVTSRHESSVSLRSCRFPGFGLVPSRYVCSWSIGEGCSLGLQAGLQFCDGKMRRQRCACLKSLLQCWQSSKLLIGSQSRRDVWRLPAQTEWTNTQWWRCLECLKQRLLCHFRTVRRRFLCDHRTIWGDWFCI